MADIVIKLGKPGSTEILKNHPDQPSKGIQIKESEINVNEKVNEDNVENASQSTVSVNIYKKTTTKDNGDQVSSFILSIHYRPIKKIYV
ncbi:hypothetical protein ABEB36_005867 [Hypothenemus hampei]|uniref:Uncharacterized protein n=1 Tax=Hypothenemus hampei TaxID=57062 RepID=A0ABD1F3J1_HYPHA